MDDTQITDQGTHGINSKQPHLANLNPQQLEAVIHHTGPILILAGAGSGKTRVLTRRIAHLILEHKERPDSILAVTFTNKAAAEMKERARSLLGEKADRVWLSTFHSSAVRILRRHADRIGYPNNFVIYDAQDSQSLMKRLLKELKVDTKKHPPYEFLSFIDRAKNNYRSPDDMHAEVGGGANRFSYDHKLRCEVYEKYQRELKKADAMDFGDLLMFQLKLFSSYPDILRAYQESFKFILVDEFQDTNQIQYKIIRLLSSLHQNILVVGDDDQSIYSFRGATVENILDFEHDYKGTKVIRLEQNYRSTKNILQASHSIIEKSKHRKKKKLWTDNEGGDKIKTYVAEDENDEAYFIANEIIRIKSTGTALSEIAVFYRTNAQSRALEEAFIRQKIPFRIFGGLKFYDRKEVKDILAYLRILVLPSDSEALLRIINTPARGIGTQAINTIIEYSNQENISLWRAVKELSGKSKPLAKFVALIEELTAFAPNHFLGEVIGEIVKKSGYGDYLTVSNDPASQSRLENLKELRGMHHSSKLGFEAISEFLERVSLTASSDLPSDSNGQPVALRQSNSGNDPEMLPAASSVSTFQKVEGAVTLMTLHLAKGLEFPTVFLTGFEEGLIPHYRSTQEHEIDEERRLCYVGMTRAKEVLYISRARRRSLFSSGDSWARPRPGSRFGRDLPDEVIEPLGGDIKGYGFEDEGFEENFSEDDDYFNTSTFRSKSKLNSSSYNKDSDSSALTTFNNKSRTSQQSRVPLAARLGLKFKSQSEILNYLGVKKASDMQAADSGDSSAYPLMKISEVEINRRIYHASFGSGTIKEIELIDEQVTEDSKLTILFDSGTNKTRRLVFKFAGLCNVE